MTTSFIVEKLCDSDWQRQSSGETNKRMNIFADEVTIFSANENDSSVRLYLFVFCPPSYRILKQDRSIT